MTITASLVFHKPFTLQKGQEVCLMYGVLIHADDARIANIEEARNAFSKMEPAEA